MYTHVRRPFQDHTIAMAILKYLNLTHALQVDKIKVKDFKRHCSTYRTVGLPMCFCLELETLINHSC